MQIRNLLLVIVVCGIIACQSNANHEKEVLQMFDAFNAHDWPKYASFYADSAQFLDPEYGSSPIIMGHKTIIEKYQGLAMAFPNINDSIINIYNINNTVIIEFIATGTGTDKTKLNLPICSVLTFKDGKIISDHTYYDH